MHFNEDDTPDFLIRLNKGEWRTYNYSYMVVLDGNNGELLWTMNCSNGAISSAVTVKSSRKGHDGMLFLAGGCEQDTKRIRRETKENGELHQVFEEKYCSHTHPGVEQRACNVLERSRRHGLEGNDNVQETQETATEDGLWEPTNKTDTFPDPWTDTRSFVQDYCEIPYDSMTNAVYFLTPNMIKAGNIKPVFENKPFVYSELTKIY